MKTISFVFSFLVFFQFANGQESQTTVLISTSYGDITAVLYNETPQHRDNFIRLINEGWYEGSPFHRVIKGFMIQGGHHSDGRVDPGYTVTAEFVEGLFHKKGALAAARQADQVNPQKASSGCQFYIVQGKQYTEAELNAIASRSGKDFSEAQIDAYTTVGGTPFLDSEYTVFGEVIDGFEVIELIAAVEKNPADQPLQDVTMSITLVE